MMSGLKEITIWVRDQHKSKPKRNTNGYKLINFLQIKGFNPKSIVIIYIGNLPEVPSNRSSKKLR